MTYRLWQAGWLVSALFTVATVTLFLAGAWQQSGRLATVGAVCLGTAGVGAFGMAVWTEDPPLKQPRLSRADRKRIRDERRRIETDRIIAEMEKEAGLR